MQFNGSMHVILNITVRECLLFSLINGFEWAQLKSYLLFNKIFVIQILLALEVEILSNILKKIKFQDFINSN